MYMKDFPSLYHPIHCSWAFLIWSPTAPSSLWIFTKSLTSAIWSWRMSLLVLIPICFNRVSISSMLNPATKRMHNDLHLWFSLHKQQWEERLNKWKDFINRIGGIEKLNFSWTRTSGKRWEILAYNDASKKRKELRDLIRGGVCAADEEEWSFGVDSLWYEKWCLVLLVWRCRAEGCYSKHLWGAVHTDEQYSNHAGDWSSMLIAGPSRQ